MRQADFTSQEMATFVERFERTPAWIDWDRVHDKNQGGSDMLRIRVRGKAPCVLRVMKTGPARFLANGFDEWNLIAGSHLGDLLDALAAPPALAVPS